jgi:hypothetical protein
VIAQPLHATASHQAATRSTPTTKILR